MSDCKKGMSDLSTEEMLEGMATLFNATRRDVVKRLAEVNWDHYLQDGIEDETPITSGLGDIEPTIGGERDRGVSLEEWLPIETAPKDGTCILVTNLESGGGWVARYYPVYPSGYRPKNPWWSVMLNTEYLPKRYHSMVPTHWQPMPRPLLPATPDQANEQ